MTYTLERCRLASLYHGYVMRSDGPVDPREMAARRRLLAHIGREWQDAPTERRDGWRRVRAAAWGRA